MTFKIESKMALGLRNIQFRDGRYYARIIVPKEVRAQIGKSELRTALGADRRIAVQQAPRAIAALRDELAAARKAVGVTRVPLSLASEEQIARLHYQEELDRDDYSRNIPVELAGVSPAKMNANFGTARAALLEKIVRGEANDEEILAVLGVSIDVFRSLGLTSVEFGILSYRNLGRKLAIYEREALSRFFERDVVYYGGNSKIPSLELTDKNVILQERDHFRALLEV